MIYKEIMDFLIKQETNENKKAIKTPFTTFVDRSLLGKKILDDLRKKRKPKEGYDFDMFISDDREERKGFLSNLYGAVGMLSLQSRMEVNLLKEDKEYLQKVTIYLLEYIGKHGYCLDPYVDEEINRRLFSLNYPYIGAMTWSLSFFTSIYNAVVLEKWMTLPEEYIQRIKDEIGKIVCYFAGSSSVNPPKDKASPLSEFDVVGWGFVRGCKRPSLFFTYSILESYSDFEDTILEKIKLTEDGKKGVGYDEAKALIDYINEKYKLDDEEGANVVDVWRDKCFRLTANVWRAYKDKIRVGFVDDNFLVNISMVDEDDIRKSNSSNALFNTLYIVFILIYGYANNDQVNRYMKGVKPDDVLSVMNSALRNVQRTYEQFKAIGIDYLIDTYRVPFKIEHEQYGFDYIKTLNSEMLIDTSILPMLVKANNMIAYYIVQYPLKEMSQLFLEIFNLLAQDNNAFWLWDVNRYDVKITERYIEAIADFYAYYKEYEDPCIKGFTKKAIAEENIEKRIRPDIEQEEREKAKQEYEEKIASAIQKTKELFSVENQLRQSTKEWAEALLIEKLHLIAENNMDSVSGKNADLIGADDLLYETFKKVLFSFLKRAIYETRLAEQKGDEDKKKINEILTVFQALVDEVLKGDRKEQ